MKKPMKMGKKAMMDYEKSPMDKKMDKAGMAKKGKMPAFLMNMKKKGSK